MQGPYLQNLAAARAVSWGKSFNWDISMPSAPEPFNKWFPAVDIDYTLANLATHDFAVGSQSFDTPLALGARELRLTFHDDEDAVLEHWIDDWFNKTLVNMDNGGAVATLSEAVRPIYLAQLNNQREFKKLHLLWVYPKGGFNSVRDSQSQMLTHVCTFSIVARQIQDV